VESKINEEMKDDGGGARGITFVTEEAHEVLE
jgi:hypothetical protein